MAEEKTVSSRYVYKGCILNLRIDSVLASDGQEKTREIIEHSGCVAVVPVDDQGNIILVRQYRKATEKYLVEIPAGGIEAGEDPEAAVGRELQEEIGFSPGKVERLGGFYSAPGFSTEYLYLYLATQLKPSRLIAEDTDEITILAVSPDRAKAMIKSGEICDSKSIAGLLQYLGTQPAK